jgi:alpha-N-arabinofuranosidase
MKRHVLLCVALAACSQAAARTAEVPATRDPRFDWFVYEGRDSVLAARIGGDRYFNPILAGFYPDPSWVRVGDDYYLVNSSFAYFPGVPIFHSKDLVNWTQIGNVLDRPSQLPLDNTGHVSRGIFAPAIRYHAGTFYMITTLVDRGNFFVTATNPAGPWSEPNPLPEVDGIDPSIFFDTDGKAYILNNGPPIGEPLYNGHRAIWMQEFDVAGKRTVGPRKLIINGGVDISKKPIWIEGPHIFKVNGKYYLICAEGGTADQHSEVVFRSDSVWGPYVPYDKNPILTQRHLDPARPNPVTSTGHADFVQTPNGEWWAIFLGVRPYREDFHNIGRETFMLPVRWVDGWPVILTGDATVPYTQARPGLPRQQGSPVPTSGNFVVRDDFSASTLPLHWSFLRTRRENWHTLADGRLTIRARPVTLESRGHPSFIGRRQQHLNAVATTALEYRPEKAGDEAGLVAFQSDDNYYALVVTQLEGRRVVALKKRAGTLTDGKTVVVASAPLSGDPAATLYLRITARGERYDFHYGTAPDRWTPLARDQDGTILSSKVAGGFSSNFVGVMFALYAYGE